MPKPAPPATLATSATGPSVSAMLLTAAWTSSQFETSARTAIARRPNASISATTSSSSSLVAVPWPGNSS